MRRAVSMPCVALLLAAACDGPAPVPPPTDPGGQGDPRNGGTAVIGVIADIQNWNPYLTETAFSDDLLNLLYPTLATEQVDYVTHPPSFAPSLAESWDWSDDRLELTFHLRKNAVWSDGVPVTAADVVFTWATQHAPELGWTGVFIKDFIDAVDAIDSHTVRFRFNRVYPYQLMDANDGMIVPAHAWSGIPYAQWQDTDWQQHTLSAGPFRLARHEPRQEIVLEANPSYWYSERPHLERVVWRIIPSQVNLVTQFRSGSLDFINTVPPREADRVRENPRTEVRTFPDRSYTFVGWNNARPLFADVRVRRALTMAIDREALVEAIRHGFGHVAVGPVLSTMWAFNRDLEPLPHSLEAAARALDGAGWADTDGDGVRDRGGVSFAFELLTNSENQERRDICVVVADTLARVGVRATPRFVEWGTMVALQGRGDFDAIVSTWREPTQVDLEDVWHSAPPGEPTSNFVRYSNPEVDRLIARVGEEPDFSRQKPLFDRIQELVVADQPYTFLYERHSLVGISSRIGGAELNDATPYFNLEEWYLRAAEGSDR